MVSKKISDACYPITIKTEKGVKDTTLVLNVVHGKEMEIEYAKNEIIDKINSVINIILPPIPVLVISSRIDSVFSS